MLRDIFCRTTILQVNLGFSCLLYTTLSLFKQRYSCAVSPKCLIQIGAEVSGQFDTSAKVRHQCWSVRSTVRHCPDISAQNLVPKCLGAEMSWGRSVRKAWKRWTLWWLRFS